MARNDQMIARSVPFVCVLALLGCQRERVVLYEGTADLISLRIEPAAASVAAGEEVVFRAIGAFPGGERDVTSDVAWSIDNSFLGALNAGRFVGSEDAGGGAIIHAELGAQRARAELTVLLDIVFVAPDAPADAPSRFDAPQQDDVLGDPELLIVYPSDETKFPSNVSGTLFQWRAGADQDLFELRFDSSIASVRIYTTQRSISLDERARAWLPRTHAGRSVGMVVRSLSIAAPETIRRSRPITLEYSAAEVRGSVYYWSTGAAAIMRASLEAPFAEKFLPARDDKKCGSCHTVSRNGRKIAFGYDGEHLRVASIPDRTELSSAESDYGWGTFSPAADRLLIAHKGRLRMLDVSSNQSSPLELPADVFATHPDWSPDGSHVALAITDAAPGNKDVKGSSLARMPIAADGTIGAIEVLLASSDPDDTIVFPSHSPDGKWIAFARTRGKSKDSEAAELYLIRSDGSAPPILLEKLNRRVRFEDGVRSIANSMPTWAPSGTAWIAFSSIRDYGDVLVNTDRDQLWVAALDLDRATAGLDPSSAAFWLPFQAIDEANHRAFWSLNPDDACPSTAEICDGIDNNCDGVADESCCTPSPEICADAIDNDCDGVADEGCGCAISESCANGLDDDCDGSTDLNDEDCAI